MRKLSFFSLLTGTLMLIAACGNDPEVEARFVSTVEKGITILDSAQTVADLVEAEDSIDKAFSIEGATELSETGAVKDVKERFEKSLTAAQQRIMDNLEKEL